MSRQQREGLRRAVFFAQMAAAMRELREDPQRWEDYVSERDGWLDPDLADRS